MVLLESEKMTDGLKELVSRFELKLRGVNRAANKGVRIFRTIRTK